MGDSGGSVCTASGSMSCSKGISKSSSMAVMVTK